MIKYPQHRDRRMPTAQEELSVCREFGPVQDVYTSESVGNVKVV